MTTRLLAAAACIAVSLTCVWLVDPESRNGAFLAKGTLWGIAGVLLVWTIQYAVRRRQAARGRHLLRSG